MHEVKPSEKKVSSKQQGIRSSTQAAMPPIIKSCPKFWRSPEISEVAALLQTSSVLFVILDLDRPNVGFITFSQQPMIDTVASLSAFND
jgi:hypothetical protein